ncbi:MAG: Nudix family hydrolase [Pseudomonadota bacterium]|nr:Nudix family hydrolase [Pseudomonadota bacterium]
MKETSAGRFLRVAVAVMLRDDGTVLLAQRLPGTPYPGYWEFPGGKLEAGESARDALVRELREELSIRVTRAVPWLVQRYVYPHAEVELHFFRVFGWQGDPRGCDGQALAWQRPGAFDVAPLLPANAAVLRALQLPPVYAITMAEDFGVDSFLARAAIAIERGVRLIQLREKSFSEVELGRLAERLLSLAQRVGARVLLNGDADLARRLGCAGVHWTSAALRSAQGRPEGMLCAASCHDEDELARAVELGIDFIVLGPLLPTPSHPAARPLGWDRFAALVRAMPVPVYALGGLVRGNLDRAIQLGAHGVALRRDAWGAAQDLPVPASESSGSTGSSTTGAR